MDTLRKLWLPALVILFGFSSFGQMESHMAALAEDDCFSQGEISFYAKEVSSDREIINYRADKLMTPASVQKLLTTATALEVLRPAYTFQTRFMIDKSDELAYGTLFGSLHIEVTGDPSFLNGDRQENRLEYLAGQCAAKLAEWDINCFYDGIVIHAGEFDHQSVPDGWLWQDIANYYGSGCYPLNYNENTYQLHFDRGKGANRPDIVKTDPSMTLDFINDVTCSGNRDEAYIYQTRDPELMLVKGKIPQGSGFFSIKGAIPDPISYFVDVFIAALQEKGISFGSDHIMLIGQEVLIDREILYTHHSSSLPSLIAETNFESKNLYAEALLLAMGKKVEGGYTYQKGLKALREHWDKKGISMANARLLDGSGLSPRNNISARSIVDVLVAMARDPDNGEYFLSSLPEAGKSGTVKNITPPDGEIWRIKSGSMDGVRAYAGYFLEGERQIAFCIMANEITCEKYDAGRKLLQLLREL